MVSIWFAVNSSSTVAQSSIGISELERTPFGSGVNLNDPCVGVMPPRLDIPSIDGAIDFAGKIGSDGFKPPLIIPFTGKSQGQGIPEFGWADGCRQIGLYHIQLKYSASALISQIEKTVTNRILEEAKRADKPLGDINAGITDFKFLTSPVYPSKANLYWFGYIEVDTWVPNCGSRSEFRIAAELEFVAYDDRSLALIADFTGTTEWVRDRVTMPEKAVLAIIQFPAHVDARKISGWFPKNVSTDCSSEIGCGPGIWFLFGVRMMKGFALRMHEELRNEIEKTLGGLQFSEL